MKRSIKAAFLCAIALSLFSCSGSGASSTAGGPTSPVGVNIKFMQLEFSGANALGHVYSQVAMGPRTSADGKQVKCAEYIASKLRECSFEVTLQSFTGSYGKGSGVRFTNVIGTFDPKKTGSYKLFGAHYDTLPCAPRDPDPSKQNTPIDGANDGAAGVAALLELARVAKARQDLLTSGVKLIFFDGEDFYTGVENMFYGSKFYAASLSPDDKKSLKYFVLLDMIGDSDLQIYKENNSLAASPDFTNYVFDIAKGYNLKGFNDTAKHTITDDHIALIEAGVTSTLLIDFDYPSWHTMADTADKVSASSLEQCGRLVEYLILN